MRILVLKTGDYGQRHIDNLREHRPDHWSVDSWQTPRSLPIVLDYPEDYLPETFQPADLVLLLPLTARLGCLTDWPASS
jgi:hypothetical protein